MTHEPAAQASNVSYELYSLGWKAFQDLCLTILRDTFGQTVEVFLPIADGGRDGAFSGTWTTGGHLALAGTFTVQCKFTSKPETSLSLSALSDEIPKAKRLVENGHCDNYLLMTNMSLTSPNEEKIRDAFQAIGVKHFVAFGYEWMCATIRESSRLRMLVPRIYGLGDLSQILDERAYEQTKEIFDSIRDELRKFVRTGAHNKAAKALLERGFAFLLGEPASGKSMIASVLAVAANDRWDCIPIRASDAYEFRKHWNPNERQFFWIDDAFGSTIYQPQLGAAWNQQFQALSAAINRGTKVVFTSRSYIFREARRELKIGAFPLLSESQIIIDVQELSDEEKDQIVYNHLKLGDQSKEFRRALKPYLKYVGRVDHFLPEIGRRLGSCFFTRKLTPSKESVLAFAENPASILDDILTGLSKDNRAAIAIIFMNGGQKESPVEFGDKERTALERLGSTASGVLEGLRHLEGSLVKLDRAAGRNVWSFKHPTIRDAFATLVSLDPELLDIYLQGTPVERIVSEISCGDIGLEGVKVIVPETRFELVAKHLDNLRAEDSTEWLRFLAGRCSREFLRIYLDDKADVVENAATLGDMHSVQARLVVRLSAFDLLPEECRAAFVVHMQDLCLADSEYNVLANESLKGLFTNDELLQTRNIIKREVFEKIEDIIADLAGSYDPHDGDPDSHFWTLESSLQQYLDEFSDDDEARMMVTEGLRIIGRTIRTLERDHEDEANREREDDEEGMFREKVLDERSPFDDVDE